MKRGYILIADNFEFFDPNSIIGNLLRQIRQRQTSTASKLLGKAETCVSERILRSIER